MPDALLPPEIARRAEELGVKKAALDAPSTVLLAVLAGAFIALGAAFATVAWAGTAGEAPWGWARVVGGACFSLGLMLVVVGGAELFTGNNLLVMAWASGRVPTARLLRNWGLVFCGNALGAVGTAALVALGRSWTFGQGAAGRVALDLAAAKLALDPLQAVVLGVLCNTLVCLAVWMSYSARSTADRLLAVFLPVTAFVACGFEHSIANLYFVPLAILIRDSAPEAFWAAIGRTPADYAALGWVPFLVKNLLPVTLGNVLGGGGLVAAVYWVVYLRPKPA